MTCACFACHPTSRVLLSRCRYHNLYNKYQQSKASFWTPEEVDLSQDQRDWDSLHSMQPTLTSPGSQDCCSSFRHQTETVLWVLQKRSNSI